MLIPLDKLRSLYDQIIKNALTCEGKGTSICIFASNELDSLCSLRMLTVTILFLINEITQGLLKADEMQYNSIPVFSNMHLIEELKKLNNNAHVRLSYDLNYVQVRSLIYINCGGIIDHSQQWYYGADSKVECFIFDSHRPFHHNNIIDIHRKIFIIHDGCQTFEKYPTAEDIQILQEIGDEDDDEDEDEIDSDEDEQIDEDREEIKEELEDLRDNSEEEEEVYGERVQRNEDDEEPEVVGADEAEGVARVGVKRPRDPAAILVDRRQLKRQKRALFQRYYSGNMYWKCSACTMY